MTFAGAVLTGGASRRMGTDKAVLPIAGQAMAVRVSTALVDAGASEVRCIGGDEAALVALGLTWSPDRHPGEGPLGGIISAMHASDHDLQLITACDLLEPTGAAFRDLVAQAHRSFDVVFPVVDERPQYVTGLWRRATLPTLEAAFTTGTRSIRGALHALRVLFWPGPASLAHDADAPHQLPGG